MKKTILIVILLALVAPLGAQPAFKRNKKKQETKKVYVEAVYSTVQPEEIIVHRGFGLSYNEDKLVPNWVTYELTAEEASATAASRTDEFLPDPDAKSRQGDTRDYSNSGYDRGHMAAAADMKWDKQAMIESFYLTNTAPQDRGLNAGLWLELEQKCRWWAKKYGQVWITCGPVFLYDDVKRIGNNGIAVPDMFFKCVCMKIGEEYTMAAFLFPNSDCSGELTGYMFPVQAAESVTGCQYFGNLLELGIAVTEYRKMKAAYTKEHWIIPNWKKK